MEDMARLALFEQNAKDSETFSKTLLKLLEYIRYILENPHENELRTVKSSFLQKSVMVGGFVDYLKYVGFHVNGETIVYPKELSLDRLRVAQAAIERKLHFSCGQVNAAAKLEAKPSQSYSMKSKLTPVHALTTSNPFLHKMESLFNNVLQYEDDELQQEARGVIPLVTLQLKAIDRMREHQKKLKSGEIKGTDMSFDIALLMELLGWFKYSFFSWVDQPACSQCSGHTQFHSTVNMNTGAEVCRVELYKCSNCGSTTQFPRYNLVRSLLQQRRGRCGEWANCFAALCRALGYDTRSVYDTTDHVWCEVFDYDSNKWLHVDPCEAKLNAPLIYEHGWGKRLQYVVACSRDDVQDVTWRYSSNHKEVLRRRSLCSERELISSILTLREHRQRQVTEARRKYLAKRALEELVQLMVERKPGDYECHGRISGSQAWRSTRGELGSQSTHVFQLSTPGIYSIRYYTAADEYRVSHDHKDVKRIAHWSAGAFQSSHLFRKEEKDWHMVYLAREEGESTGSITWRIAADSKDVVLTAISVRAVSKLYEDGKIDWRISFDGEDPSPVEFNATASTFERRFTDASLTCTLHGGTGDVAWQHAQLFRQTADDAASAMEIVVSCARR